MWSGGCGRSCSEKSWSCRPVNEIAQIYGQIQTAVAGAERVFAVLDEETEDKNGGTLETGEKAAVFFQNVCFSYEPGTPVIRDFTLAVPNGRKVAAVEMSQCRDMIGLLPQGYDTVLTGSGANISQGQRQLLAIARAFVAAPKILILDEATSNVDTRTEKAIQDAMHSIMQGRTSIVIAHRLSTIRGSDLIVVMDHGEIAESGSHEELLAKKGRYYELYMTQYAGFAV